MQVTNPTVQTHEGTAHASPQLVKAANDFEANFLGELLKPMRENPLFGDGSGLGGDSLGSDGPGGAMGTIGNLASEAFAQAIAKQGGLGIAKQVLAELAPVEAANSLKAGLLAGPECGGGAATLSMATEAQSALEAGSVEMLGQGNLPGTQSNLSGKNNAGLRESKAHESGNVSVGNPVQRAGAVRAIEHVR